MTANQLHVFAARFNPLRWEQPHRHFLEWSAHMLDSGVKLTVIECQYGERPFACALPHVNHVGVRADSWVWSKENLLNLGIARVPEAKYICFSDADVFHRRPDWAAETVEAMQHYRIGQPWSDAYDLGPNDEHIQHHVSFCRQLHLGKPLISKAPDYWKADNYAFPHPGYCWFILRHVLDWVGGLFEYGGMGSADHHMALALAGKVAHSVPAGAAPSYLAHLQRWEQRVAMAVNGRIGYVPGTVEHRFHGRKADRGYLSRWKLFVRHGFDPDTDLKRNSNGVLEFSGNKPEMEREWDLYLRHRAEDVNSLR
jgi:hypothetical protein